MSGPRFNSIRSAGLWCAAMLMLFCGASPLWAIAQDAAAESLPQFQRVYVPADQLQKSDWAQGYLPIDVSAFKQLVETVHAGATGAPTGAAAKIEHAEYTARLVGEDLLVGSGLLRLARPAAEPAVTESWLALEPCSPALAGAQWQDPSGKPAVLGSGPDGAVRLLAEGSRLRCDWSLRGERTASGSFGFGLELPIAPMNRLVVEAPATLEIVADRGIASKSAGDEPGSTRWTFELGANNRVNLRVLPEGTARERRPLTLLRQVMTYELSPRGIELRAQLELDVHGEGLERITVHLDPTLRLVAARYGELQIPFSATENVETRMSHIVLELPAPIVGTARVLQLTAIAPPAIGRLWRLPGLRPEGMAWQEGTATLLIPGSLVLERLETDGCRQSRIAVLPAPASGESIDIQYFRPGANIDVLLRHPREQWKIESAAVVEVSPNQVSSRQAVRLSVAQGKRRQMHAEINPEWTIDGVDDLATNRPVEWDLEELIPDATHLRVRLPEAISAERAARLLVRGHRELPLGTAFEARQLEMLSFDPSPGAARLINVRGAEGMELHWSGAAEDNRLDPLKLSEAERQLFPQPPQGTLFAIDSAFEQSTVAVARRAPTYTADIRIDAAVSNDILTETYTLECVPETSRVDRLLVRLSRAREAPLDWQLAGASTGEFSARKISAAEQAQVGLPEGGEAWELSLHLTRPGAFELRGVRESPLREPTPLALASVGQAGVQRGTITIRALGATGLAIRNRRLESVPAELLEAGRYQTARATYHYQPGRDDLGNDPAVSISPAPSQQAESGAWVWSSRLDSRYASHDTTVHWATLRMQTAGRQQIRVTLPDDAQLQAGWLDDERLPLVLDSDEAPGFLVDLPPGRSYSALSLYYATPGALPSLANSSGPAFPAVDIPILSRQWVLWLPRGYEVAGLDGQFPLESMPPLTLTERLFGGLGRGTREKLFNPLAASDWRMLSSAASELRRSREAARQFAASLGARVAEYLAGEAESELTWGQLLSMCAEREAQSQRTLLVDIDALAWQKMGQKVRVRFQPGDTAFDRGAALLEHARLAVLVDGDVIAITAANTAALEARQLAQADHDVLLVVKPGSLAEELQRAARSSVGPRFHSVALWRQSPQSAPLPWTQLEAAARDTREARDWNTYVMQLSQAGTPRVQIVHTSAMISLAWTMFLACMAIGLWRFQRRPVELYVVGSLAAVMALLLPGAYAPLASAVFLAALVCLLLRLTRIPQPSRHEHRETARSSRARVAVARLVGLFVMTAAILNTALTLWAQPPAAPSPANKAALDPAPDKVDAPPATKSQPAKNEGLAEAQQAPARVHRVVVPVDDKRQLVGNKYYLPDELYRQLHRLAASAGGKPKGWLIRSAMYHGTLARDPLSKQLAIAQLKATFDLHVLQENVEVRLPFPREGAAQPVAGVRVDGHARAVEWTSAGDSLLIGSLPADRYRLELDLQAPPQTYVNTAGFDLAIPPLAGAVVELTLPADAPAIDLPSARGQVRMNKQHGQLHAQLGATGVLSVRWPVGIGMEAAPANLQVEELIWVKVRPGTTVFDAKFKYRVVEGSVRQIQLLTDPRLRLLPPTTSASTIAAVHTVPGDPQRIDLELARTVTDQVTLDLSFLLTGTSGVGNLQMPRLESRGARATRRWLAASADPALQSKELPGEDCRPLAIADFMAAWGTTESRPQAAYGIPRGEAMWVLATQPGEPRTTVEQSLAASLGLGTSLVQFDAALTIAGGYLFQLELQGPSGFAVERVSVLEDDVERVARWSIDDSGRITVFLSSPITGRQQLTLRGRATLTPDASGVPALSLVGAQIKRNRWRIHRHSSALVEVVQPPGVSAVELADEKPLPEFGALVGSYESQDPQALVEAKVTPNAPRSKIVTVTTLSRDGERWIAELSCRVEMLEGILDALTFEVPSQWSETNRVEPAADVKLVQVPGETRRQLVIVPPKPISGTYSLKIRGRVGLSAGDRLRMPDVVPLRAQQVERYVVLPQRLDLQAVAWETAGLSRATLPAAVAADARVESSAAVYQVTDESFQASLKAVPRAGAAARVKLADVHIAWQADGHCRGLATFDLEPAGATNCVLELPADCELLHASIDSLAAQLTSLGENRWRMSLGPPELPQRIEVTYAGSSSGSGNRRRFEAPRLLNLEVDATLWTVYGPSQSGAGQPSEGPQTRTAATHDLDRIRSTAALVQLPAELIGKHLPEEIARWYRPWKQRYADSRASLAWQLAASTPNSEQSAEGTEARQIDAKIAELEARLGSPQGEAPRSDHGDEFGRMLTGSLPHSRPTRCAVTGPSRALELYYPQAESQGWLGRIAVALAFVLLGAAGLFVLPKGPLPKLPAGRVVIALGFAWWLLLSPSIIGLAAIAAGVWIAIREREAPRSSATLQRAGY